MEYFWCYFFFIPSGDLFISNYIKLLGQFLSLIKADSSTTILASLIKGISDLKDISKLSKMGGRTIITYLITTLTAVTIGLILVNVIKPGKSISIVNGNELVEAYASDTQAKQKAAAKQQELGPLQALVDMVLSTSS